MWLLQKAWRAWGYTGTHGRTLDVVVSRPICGVRLWLVACHRDGEGSRKKKKEKLLRALGNTRDAEFAGCCFADNFCACMPRNIHTGYTLGMSCSLGGC